MKRKLLYLCLSTMALFAASCDKDPNENPKGAIVLAQGQESRLTVESSASQATIAFKATLDWSVELASDDWIDVAPQSGKAGDCTLTVTIKENADSESRNTAFDIVCSNARQPIEIVQAGHEDDGEYVHIPDLVFNAYCINNFDKDRDGKLSLAEAEAITEIDCSNQGISSLTGIEKMTNLRSINCRYNTINGVMSFAGMTQLETVICDHNLFEKLDFSGCTALKSVTANDNYKIADDGYTSIFSLEEIDLTGCSALEEIDLTDNILTELDVTDCVNMRSLNCRYNRIKSLDVSKCTKLRELSCRTNQLSGILDVSKCPELTLSLIHI